MADKHEPQQHKLNMDHLDLPPGFRFHPSDVEIISDYLMNKVRNTDFTCIAIGEVDLNKTEPWDLPDQAKWGEKEWYFFCQKDRKYPTGLRANRATEAGYWKATGKDKEVYKNTEGMMLLVGMKKTLVFYKGRAPRGDKTNWVMHEYRLEGSGRLLGPTSTSNSTANTVTTMKASSSASKDEWVVCRVFEKTTGIKKTTIPAYQVAMASGDIDPNQNNVPSLPIPMSLPVSMPMQFQILPDFSMDLMAPYYPNAGAGMPTIMPPTAGIGGAGGLHVNGALFGNPIAAPPQMNFYNQMGIGAIAGQMGMGAAAGQMGIGASVVQMDMGAPGPSGFDVAATESRPSSMVSQKDEQANAVEISSMMSVTGPRSATTTIDMDGIWKYKY